MRRILRILLNALTVLFLVLATLVTGLWVRSYWKLDVLSRMQLPYEFTLISNRGKIALVVAQHQGFVLSPRWSYASGPARVTLPGYDAAEGRSVIGFKYVSTPWTFAAPGIRGRWDYITVPSWSALIAAIVLPAVRWRHHQRHREFAAGVKTRRCFQCGYDLRATPERCPECGAVPVASVP